MGTQQSSTGAESKESKLGHTETVAPSGPGEHVYLNVYEPTEPQGSMPGFGVYHSGVEVFGTEYVFAGTDTASSGVYTQRCKWQPASSPWRFKESIDLGSTSLTRAQVQANVNEMKRDWPGNSYHLTARNCNHYSEAMCKMLGLHDKFPAWVNRAAKVGDSLRGLVGDSAVGGAGKAMSGSGSLAPPDMPPVDAKQLAVAQEALKIKPIELVDLLPIVDLPSVGCLNQSSQAGRGIKTLFIPYDPKAKNAGFLQSGSSFMAVFSRSHTHTFCTDADEQLLIFIPFKRPVKIHSLQLLVSNTSQFCLLLCVFSRLKFQLLIVVDRSSQSRRTTPKSSSCSKISATLTSPTAVATSPWKSMM